jgi:GNAT superfamily N-acetyltransferase
VRAAVEAGAVYVAERDGVVVGALLVAPEAPGYVPRDALPDGLLYIVQVVSVRDDRGRGVGRRLMEEAERIATSAGVTAVALDHWAGSPELASTYERYGYRAVDEFVIEQRGEPWPGTVRLKSV